MHAAGTVLICGSSIDHGPGISGLCECIPDVFILIADASSNWHRPGNTGEIDTRPDTADVVDESNGCGCSLGKCKGIRKSIGDVPCADVAVHKEDSIGTGRGAWGSRATIVSIPVESQVMGDSDLLSIDGQPGVSGGASLWSGGTQVSWKDGSHVRQTGCIRQVHRAAGVQLIVKRCLVQKRQDESVDHPAIGIDKPRRKHLVSIVIVMKCQANLLQIIFTL